MLKAVLRAKLHRLKVTETNINYEGSLTVDRQLLDAAGLEEGDKVQVVNIASGVRFETYVLAGKEASGEVCLNGGAARLGTVGDLIIVIAYGLIDRGDKLTPKVVYVDEKNHIVRR